MLVSKLYASIMKNKIIPLLSEYFYDDYEKIELILGGSGKDNDNNYLLNKTTKKHIRLRILNLILKL